MEKLPRMKKKEFSTLMITKKLYREFKKEFPDHKKMTWDTFYSLWKDIAETIQKEAITNPLGVKLGAYLGEIKYQYLPYKARDKAFTKAGPVNLLTKGKIPVVKWERKWACRFNKTIEMYGFQENREMNNLAKDYILHNPEKVRTSNSLYNQ